MLEMPREGNRKVRALRLEEPEEILTTLIHYPSLVKYLELRGISIEQYADETAARYRERIPQWYNDWISRRDELIAKGEYHS